VHIAIKSIYCIILITLNVHKHTLLSGHLRPNRHKIKSKKKEVSMLTGESSLDAWLRGYEVDSVLGRKSGSGRGSRNWEDVPRHRYANWKDTSAAVQEAPTDETHHATGEVAIGDIVVRNTITGEVRKRREVWAHAMDAHYTVTDKGEVIAAAPVVDTAVESRQAVIAHLATQITIAPRVSLTPWASGEACEIPAAAA